MPERHLLHAFDHDLREVQAEIMKMGGLVEEAILESAHALFSRDPGLAVKVCSRDREVDALEARITEEAMRLLALRQPTGAELRFLLAAIKIAGNLERIGDYARNLARRAAELVNLPDIDGARRAIRRMAKEVEQILKDALEAYMRQDAPLPRKFVSAITKWI